MRLGPKEIAEAMAAEGIEADVIKRVIVNLGFSQEEAVRAAARACIGTASAGTGKEEGRRDQQRGEGYVLAKAEGEGASAKDLQRKVSILEKRVSALIELLSDYVPEIVERVRAKEAGDGGVRGLL